MSIFDRLALTCAAISAALALLFLALGVVRSIQLWRATSAVKDAGKAEAPEPGLDAELQAGIAVEPDKVFEAAAKLTDSLAKAPLAVVSIVMALLFMLLAILAAYLGRPPADQSGQDGRPTETSALVPGERCTVGSFASGEHALPAEVRDEPAGCLRALTQRLADRQLGALLLVGRCDVQELKPAARARYTENLSLAYQRGLAVRATLTANLPTHARAQLEQRAVVLVGGAQSERSTAIEDTARAKDRVVELLPFWIAAPAGAAPKRDT